MRRFVSEHGAVDALLSFAGSGVDAVVDETAPGPHGVSVSGAEYPFLAGADEQNALPAIPVLVGAVVALIEFEAVEVAIERQPPDREHEQSTYRLRISVRSN